MYICRIDNPTGELKSNEEGVFRWIAINEINNISKPLPELQEIVKALFSKTNTLTFKELNQYPNEF